MQGRFLVVILSLVISWMAGCMWINSKEPGSSQLIVFAAASLTEAMQEMISVFEESHPDVKVVLNLASSYQLAQQLLQGAPADVFASANQRQMNLVIENGRIELDNQKTFAYNRLVVIYPWDNPARIHDLKDLAKPGVRLLFAAKEVPIGSYSLEFLERASQSPEYGPVFKDQVLENVVSYEESVKFVYSKVSLGESDAGIVYKSDIIGNNNQTVGSLDIPEQLNPVASYPIAPIQDSHNLELAQAFVDFVISQPGQEILKKHGFITYPP